MLLVLQHVQCDVLQQPHSILANISQTVGMDEAESSAGSAVLVKHHRPSLQPLEHSNLKLFKAICSANHSCHAGNRQVGVCYAAHA